MKIAILILAHKPLFYFEKIATANPNLNFYIHMDAKCTFSNTNLPNFHFIPNRIDVKWGGFSQVTATINLLNFALLDQENEYFHIISGEDVFLCSNENMHQKLTWGNDDIFIELKNSKKHHYRVRFPAIHVETTWQRKTSGKILTQTLKILDFLIPTSTKYWFGSNWFSIRRSQLISLLTQITKSDLLFFQKRLNPDEHFFQYLIKKSNFNYNINSKSNNRFIHFDKNFNNGNNPIYLTINELLPLSNQQYFFARKVNIATQIEFYQLLNTKK